MSGRSHGWYDRIAVRGGRACWTVLAAVVLIAAAIGPSQPQGFEEDPNWPCIQRKVPAISAGQIWAGPPVEDIGDSWRDDPVIVETVAQITSRRTPLEEAKAAIEQFAEAAGADKDRRLTMLFAGMLETINRDRGSIIAGIERYAQRQRVLAEKIESQTAELDALATGGTPEQTAERTDLEEIQQWDIRIFEERERALTYVCEQPIILEQRAFALAREMMNHLD